MGTCTRCGKQTEPDAGFCPDCGGYPTPSTVYSYAPSTAGRSGSDTQEFLAALSFVAPPPSEEPPGASSSEPWLAGPLLTAVGPEEMGPGLPGADDIEAVRLPGEGPPAVASADEAAWAPALWAEDVATGLRASTESRREARRLVVAAALTVLLIAAGTVVLAFARPGSASSQQPPTRAPRVSAPARPVPSASAGTLVELAEPSPSWPHQAAVLSFLTTYFTAINHHDFAAYERLFSPAVRADLSEAGFGVGYGTTTDSGITLHGITVIGAGELVAQVTFTSHQMPATSPNNSACTAWSVSLYLLSHDGSYQLQQPPAGTGYQPSFAACPKGGSTPPPATRHPVGVRPG